jgi:hypothetical protein
MPFSFLETSISGGIKMNTELSTIETQKDVGKHPEYRGNPGDGVSGGGNASAQDPTHGSQCFLNRDLLKAGIGPWMLSYT